MHVTEPFPYTTDALILVEYGRALDKIHSLSLAICVRATARACDTNPFGVRRRLSRNRGESRAGKADMIIMGTPGRRGMDHLLLGSVAEKVVRRPVVSSDSPFSIEVGKQGP